MSQQRSTVFENGFAEFTDQLSAVCAATPKTLGKFVMGDHPTRWHRTTVPANHVDWIHVPGVKESGNRPATYTHAAVLRTDRSTVYEYTGEPGTGLAGAYAIGANVMAASVGLSEEDLARTAADADSQPLYVAFRVGKGDMLASLGVVDEDVSTFYDLRGPCIEAVELSAPIEEVAERYPNAYWL